MKAIKILCLLLVLPIRVLGSYNQDDYSMLINKISIKRDSFHIQYNKADENEKNIIVNDARMFLTSKIKDDLFNFWYGTPWDFYGTTTSPGKGKIACGYFVTTVLRDVGFKIPRIKWAQLASESMILKFSPDNIKRFSNKSFSEVESYLFKRGDGFYLTGLDCHVGFLYVNKDTILFIHSNYYLPEIGVMSENIKGNNPFYFSKYRVISKLFSDKMIVNWICLKEYDK